MSIRSATAVIGRHISYLALFLSLELLLLWFSGSTKSLANAFLFYPFEIAYFYFLGGYVFSIVPLTVASRVRKTLLIIGACALLTTISILLLVALQPDQAHRDALLAAPATYSMMLYRSLYVMGYAGAYWLGRDNTSKKNKLMLQALAFENNKIVLENAVLQARINPHLQLNVLNRLYSLYRPLSATASDIILAFSELTQHALVEPEADGKVPLEREIENIETLIKLHRLCADHTLALEFINSCSASGEPLLIPPILLVPLVENVFKHGLLSDADHPAAISIRLNRRELLLTTSNRKLPWRDLPSYNIGLDNVKTRLARFYPDEHQLEISDNEQEFFLKLQIQL